MMKNTSFVTHKKDCVSKEGKKAKLINFSSAAEKRAASGFRKRKNEGEKIQTDIFHN